MKNTLIASLTATLCIAAAACNNTTTTTTTTTDTVKTVTVTTPPPRQWVIKDSSMYSPKFLHDLYNTTDGKDSVSLIDNIIVAGHDTIPFPDYFIKNRRVELNATKDSSHYKLAIFNGTYTNIWFDFSVAGSNHGSQHFIGQAELKSDFFATKPTETDADNPTDTTTYTVTTYSGQSDRYTYNIKIGRHSNTLLGTFSAYAKDSLRDKGFTQPVELRTGQ